MQKPTIHLIGCFHTIIDLQHTHCAFSQKVLRFPKMMQPFGYNVIEYSNGTSESTADEHVQILTKDELELLSSCWIAARQLVPQTDKLFGDQLHLERERVSNDLAASITAPMSIDSKFHGDTAAIGSPHWREFNKRLIIELKKRVKPGDIIAHPFGRSHVGLLKEFPSQQFAHVETGIGYPDAPFGCFRIFETYNWQSWHHGKHNSGSNDYEWVIPNYYDLEDWTPRDGKNDGYLLYFGRVCPEKGMNHVAAIAEALQEEILVVGQGDPTPWTAKTPYLKSLGAKKGRERDELLRGARALLMPTRFHEPFGGAGVEGQLVGTPLIASDCAAFAETVTPSVNGFRCKQLADWVAAAEAVKNLDRSAIATEARRRYSLETCGAMFDEAFKRIHGLYTGRGWYHIPGKS